MKNEILYTMWTTHRKRVGIYENVVAIYLFNL